MKRSADKDVPTDYSEQKPWSACFGLAAADTAFWDEQVRHRAAAWVAAGSGAHRWRRTRKWPRCICRAVSRRSSLRWRGLGRTDKQRWAAAAQELHQLRAWKQARTDTGGSGEGSPGKATGRGNNNKKGKSNLHSKTRNGKEVCYSWNNNQGKCADVAPGKPCPSGRAHVCQKCLSDRHRSAECPQSD